ncbi:hypothetical protein D3C87_2057010 [compost metagenome]
MQMKVIVDSPEDYKKWLANQASLVSQVKASLEQPADAAATATEGEVKTNDTVTAEKVAVVVEK